MLSELCQTKPHMVYSTECFHTPDCDQKHEDLLQIVPSQPSNPQVCMQSSTEGVDCSNPDARRAVSTAACHEVLVGKVPRSVSVSQEGLDLKTSFKKDQGGFDEPRDQRGCL